LKTKSLQLKIDKFYTKIQKTGRSLDTTIAAKNATSCKNSSSPHPKYEVSIHERGPGHVSLGTVPGVRLSQRREAACKRRRDGVSGLVFFAKMSEVREKGVCATRHRNNRLTTRRHGEFRAQNLSKSCGAHTSERPPGGHCCWELIILLFFIAAPQHSRPHQLQVSSQRYR